MPRKGHVRKRETVPDTRFGNPAVAKFISSLMKGGKKSVAERILYTALDNAAEKLGTELEIRKQREAVPEADVSGMIPEKTDLSTFNAFFI